MRVKSCGVSPCGMGRLPGCEHTLQASPAELDQALQERHALCLDGRYCRQAGC